jgi:hypothetical protein
MQSRAGWALGISTAVAVHVSRTSGSRFGPFGGRHCYPLQDHREDRHAITRKVKSKLRRDECERERKVSQRRAGFQQVADMLPHVPRDLGSAWSGALIIFSHGAFIPPAPMGCRRRANHRRMITNL